MAPSVGSATTLWMTADGTVFNRQMSLGQYAHPVHFSAAAYTNREQRKTVKLWFDAARWCYNQTIETLRQPDTTANWKKIKTPIIKAIPSHLAPAPYQVKSIAVRDACKAVSNAKIFNIGLKKDQAAGIRLDETFAEPGF